MFDQAVFIELIAWFVAVLMNRTGYLILGAGLACLSIWFLVLRLLR